MHYGALFLEITSASQSKDVEPFILQSLSFSVTPACKSL